MLIGELLDVVTVWKRSQRPLGSHCLQRSICGGASCGECYPGRCGLLASLGSPPSPGIWCGHDCTRPWSRSGKAPSSITLASRAALAQRSLFLRIGRRCLIQCNCRLELPPAFDSPWLCSSITSSFSSMTCKPPKRSADLSALSRPTVERMSAKGPPTSVTASRTRSLNCCFSRIHRKPVHRLLPYGALAAGCLARTRHLSVRDCMAARSTRSETVVSTWPFRPPYLPEAMHIRWLSKAITLQRRCYSSRRAPSRPQNGHLIGGHIAKSGWPTAN